MDAKPARDNWILARFSTFDPEISHNKTTKERPSIMVVTKRPTQMHRIFESKYSIGVYVYTVNTRTQNTT